MAVQNYFPTNGTTADGTGTNDNFIEIFGNITNINIAASAGIVFSKLDSTTVAGVTASQTLTNKTLTSPTITTPAISSPTFTGVMLIPSGGSASAPTLAVTGDTNTGLYASSADNLAIVTGGSSAVDVSSSLVSVSGARDFSVPATQKVSFNGATLTTYAYESSAGDFSIVVTGSTVFESTTSSTFLAIAKGDTTASAANMVIDSGTGRVQRSTSSIKYKEDVLDLEIDSTKIFDLRPVSYTSKSDKKRYFGMIAEEVNEILPELVYKDADGNCEGIHYAYLSVLLLNELKKMRGGQHGTI